MNLSTLNQERRIIPRWRVFSVSRETGELGSPLPRTAVEKDTAAADPQLAEHVERWRTTKSIANAIDLVSSALILRVPNVALDAAVYLRERLDGQDEPAIAVVNALEGPSQFLTNEIADAATTQLTTIRDHIGLSIACVRAKIKRFPHDATLWVEMSRLYTVLGFAARANRAMSVALSLAARNRFVVRSAVRLAVHQNDPQRAQSIIRRSHLVQTDPWILASEISVCCILNRSSPFVRLGRKLARDTSYAPSHTSELSSALATLELRNGSNKAARNFFADSLVKPTDNSLAQAEWAAGRISSLPTRSSEHVPRAFEADARHALRSGDWQQAIWSTSKWALDEPFSSGPSASGSYIACALLEDFDTGIDFCNLGLLSNPDDIDLLNNLAVAYALKGDIAGAIKVFKSIPPVSSTRIIAPVLLATSGLLAFQSGDVELGRNRYNDAIHLAQTNGQGLMKKMAAIYFAREEIGCRSPDAAAAFNRAVDLCKSEQSLEIQQMMANLRSLYLKGD